MTSCKIMLVTNELDNSPNGGRAMLCKMNHDMLKQIYGDKCTVLELAKTSIRNFTSIINAFRGYIDGLSDFAISKALQEIQSGDIEKVFVDGSNLGEVVLAIKKKFPRVQVYTFFHNVESRFFWGALRQTKTPRAIAVLMVNFLAERKAVQHSDSLICLNERDSQLLNRLYGRRATHVSPMTLRDKLPQGSILPKIEGREKFALFVGGVFYANRVGIAWFVKNVAPYINIKTRIVGRGFEKYRADLEIDGKVEVIGEVESMAKWYQDAYFVIAPIFDGSGMKTKVAEALMFGKKVIGTPEAFTGYEDIADRAGRVCRTSEEFVDAIDSADEIVNSSFDLELRQIYEKKYSYAAAKVKLEHIMGL